MNFNIYITKRRCLILLFSLFVFIYLFIGISKNIFSESYYMYGVYIVLGNTIYLAIKNIRKTELFLVYVFMTFFNYSFIKNNYFDRYKGGLFNFADEMIWATGIYIILLFTCILVLYDEFYNKYPYDVGLEEKTFQIYKYKPVISIIFIVIMFFLTNIRMVFGNKSSQILGYAAIFLVLGFYYAGNNKRIITALTAVSIYQALIILIVEASRLMILPYIIIPTFMTVINRYRHMVKARYIILGVIVGIYFMTYFGLYGDSGQFPTFGETYETLKLRGFALDTAQFAYLHSIIMVKVKTFTNTETVINLFKQFALSQFLGNGVGKYTKLQKYTIQFYNHFNGGIWPYYFYFYGGWIGVILSSIYIGMCINFVAKIRRNVRPIIYLLGIYTVAKLPEWYLYEPNQLLKGYIFLIVGYFLCEYLSLILYKNSR